MGCYTSSNSVYVGSNFNVTVWLNTSDPVDSWWVGILSYNTTVLKMADATSLSMNSLWRTGFYDNGTIDNNNGKISGIQAWINTNSTSNTTLFNVTFNAKKPGTCNIKLYQAEAFFVGPNVLDSTHNSSIIILSVYSPGGGGGTDTTSPSIPTNVRCTTPKIDNTPSFAWNAATDESGISSYIVKIDNGEEIEIGNVQQWTSTSVLEDGNHTFYVKAIDGASNPGTYGSCSFIIDTTITGEPPEANAGGPYTGLNNQTVVFDGSSSTDDISIKNFTWDFGDGNFGYGPYPNHIYQDVADYNVTLTVRDDDGLTDTDTTIIKILLDSDGDGWSDTIEKSYDTNTSDPDNKPIDTDYDGIPDDDSPDGNYTGDSDDDNDLINDYTELNLGSDPLNNLDVKQIKQIEGGFVVDIDNDEIHDRFYNSNSGIITTINVKDDGTYLLDINGDGKWDYIYNPLSDSIESYEEKSSDDFPWIPLIIGFIILIIIVTIFLLFKTGYLYIEVEEQTTDEKINNVSDQSQIQS